MTKLHTFDKVKIKFSRLHVGNSDVILVICFDQLQCTLWKYNKDLVEKDIVQYTEGMFLNLYNIKMCPQKVKWKEIQ